MTGTILGKFNNKYIVQPTDSEPNRNTMVVGGPGSYKTQGYVITNVLNETENSIVVTDPKGEVYENTADFKDQQGYNVHVLNFANMDHSDRYNPLDYVRQDIDATKVATKFVSSEDTDGKKDVWFNTQRQLLSALILYVIHEYPPEYRNMKGVMKFLYEHNTSDEASDKKTLDEAFQELRDDHQAKRLYELGYKKTSGEMKSSVISSLLSTIGNYNNETVAEFTSFSDFHLRDIGRKKIILYLIIPTMDSTFEGLVNLFITQLFDELQAFGDEEHSKLPTSVNFILDEFVNLGKIEKYEEFLATCRGYGIGVSTIIQNLTQLQDRYNKERAESILGNCNVQICMGAANQATAKYFSDSLGKATVKVETENISTSNNTGQDGSSTSQSENESYSGRDLMTAGEIKTMPDDTQLIVFGNKPPIKAKKALQFNIFPEPENLLSQLEYERNREHQQKKAYDKAVEEYNNKIEQKEREKAQRKKEMEVEREQREQEKEDEAINSLTNDSEYQKEPVSE